MKLLGVVSVLLPLLCHQSRAAEFPTNAIVITAKPRFKTEDNFRDLIISDGNRSYEIGWAAVFPFRDNVYFYPVSLHTRKSYTFTVVEDRECSRHWTNTIPRLVRVVDDGRVIYDVGICEIHKTKMDQKEVPIVYGLIDNAGQPSAKTERRKFPHRHEVAFGGCVVSPDSPKTRAIYICSECQREYRNWKTKHPEPKK